jgi:hypothetical protein
MAILSDTVFFSGDRVYFGSSVDRMLDCLRVGDSSLVWSFVTGGSICLAPTVWQDRAGYRRRCRAAEDDRLP